MLKVEKLDFAEGLHPGEARCGEAELTLGDATLCGNFHLENTANGVVACVGLVGKNADATPFKATEAKLTLTSKVIRKVVVKEGENSVVVDGTVLAGTKAKVLTKLSTAKVSAADIELTPNADGTAEATVEADSAGILALEVPVVVADGALENKLANKPAEASSDDHVVEAGKCRVEAVIPVLNNPDLKENKTTWVNKGAQIKLIEANV